jgi:hypothetical protein
MEKGPNSQTRIAKRRALYLESLKLKGEQIAARQKLEAVQKALVQIDTVGDSEPLTNSFEAMIRYKERAAVGVKR